MRTMSDGEDFSSIINGDLWCRAAGRDRLGQKEWVKFLNERGKGMIVGSEK